MRSNRSPAAVSAIALGCALGGCFYDWTIDPTDSGHGDGGAGSGTTTGSEGAGAPDAGSCATCVAAAVEQCPGDAADCSAYEACAVSAGCSDAYSCIGCIQDHQEGFTRWSCLDSLCDEPCAGVPIPCG